MIIAFVLSVLNSTTEVRVRPERSRFGLGLRMERTHLSSDGRNDRRQLGNCSGQRIKQVGYVADRIGPRIGPRIGIGARLLSIILLCVLLAGITRGNYDDNRLSALGVYMLW